MIKRTPNRDINDINSFEMTKDVPTTPIVKELMSIISGSLNDEGNRKRYRKNVNDASRGKTKIITYHTKDEKTLRIEVETGQTKSIIEIPSLLELSKQSFATTKLFLYIMHKGIEQNVVAESGKDISIEFTLADMVADGLYTDARSARRAFKDGMDILMALKATGEIRMKSGTVAGRKEITPDKDKARVMFIGRDIEKAGKSPCKVYLNPLMNWDFLLHFYTTVPVWTFQLPKRAMNLMFWIFVNARTNVGNLTLKGPNYITASYKSVQTWLNLPRLDETDTPKKEIIQPIHAAIADIEAAHNNFKQQILAEIKKEKDQATTDEERKAAEEKEAYYKAMFDKPDFKITTEEPADAKTKDILTNGKLIANINEPYTTKLFKIRRATSALLKHSKATKDGEPTDN